jgi:kynurenine formamidase
MKKRYPRFLADISIPLNFSGAQPNHFGTPPAAAKPLRAGDFIGDTKQGGSCNVAAVTVIPHCNGTHTECIGHIVDEAVFVNEVLQAVVVPAVLVSVTPTEAPKFSESYRPRPSATDAIIERCHLERKLEALGVTNCEGLIIRTLPNADSKKTRDYSNYPAPFFSIECMRYIASLGVRHLLVDVPSLDKAHDEGLLTCHHIFWNLPEGSHRLNEAARVDRTVTEMIFVPEHIPDGFYDVSIQIPDWQLDAAPSRVLLLA